MSGRKVRVGLIGCGGIAGAHKPGFDRVRDVCAVVAVAEPNPGRAAWIREAFGPDVRIVDDYPQLLAMADVDAVDILLPHDLHLPAVLAAAQAQKPVLVEKVMARNIWECDRMLEACARAGVSLTICHDRRYQGEWTALKTVVDSGALGEIFSWKLDHNQDVWVPPDHWIRSKDKIGGGAIMSCLTHQIDALRWYGGEVARVTCRTKTNPERMEGEFLGTLIADMKSGALAELSINWWTRSNRGQNALWYERVQVCGTKGEAYFMSGRGTFVRLHDAGNEAAVQRFGEAALKDFVPVPCDPLPGHVGCIVEWVKHLHGEPADIRTSGIACRGTVEVAEAAYQSVAESRTVNLPIQPSPWGSK